MPGQRGRMCCYNNKQPQLLGRPFLPLLGSRSAVRRIVLRMQVPDIGQVQPDY